MSFSIFSISSSSSSSNSDTLIPRVLWAQRHDTVFLTFEVFEVKNEKVDIKAEGVSFSGTRSSDDAKFAVDLQLFGAINPESSKINVTHREVSVVLKKAESGPYWPRLLKSSQKMHFIHTDFSKWIDEDEEDEEEAGAGEEPGFGQFGDFNNFAQFGQGFGGAEEESFEEESFEEKEEEEEVDDESFEEAQEISAQ